MSATPQSGANAPAPGPTNTPATTGQPGGTPTSGADATCPYTVQALAERWWLVLLRGISAILFGVLAVMWPALTLLTLVVLYGAFALADGAFAIGAAISGKGPSGARWWLVFAGLLGIATGVITFLWPGITALVLLIFIAVWSIFTGVMQIVAAIQLRKEIDHEWLLVASGLISVLFGAVLIMQPGAGALALVWLIAAFAFASGIVYVAWAFRLRGLRGKTPTVPRPA